VPLTTPKQTIKITAIACSNDDGSNPATVTINDIRAGLADINGLYERAGLEFTIDDGDFVPVKETRLNTITNPATADAESEARFLANANTGKVVVILRRGSDNFSMYNAVDDYVVMKNDSFSGIEFAHELGHYFNLPHPFPDAVGVNDLTQAMLVEQVRSVIERLVSTPEGPGSQRARA
jgi:hypothetical protein